MSDWLIGFLVFLVIAALVIWLLPSGLFQWIGIGTVVCLVLGAVAKKAMK